QSGGSWDELGIGDELDTSSILRLSDDGYAELLVGDALVSLTRDGTYNISDLVKGSSSVQTASLDLKKKLTLSTGHDKWRHEATMGVRGAEAATLDSTGMEDAYTYLEAGMEAMAEENYEEALINFEEGWDFFEDQNCLLFTAICYEQLGQKRSYVRMLQDVDSDYLETEYMGTYAVRMGDLMIRSLQFDDALSVLGSVDEDYLNSDEAQQIQYLMGTAYLGNGDERKARTSYQKARDIAPSTEMGRLAADTLSSL
ncbi:MAG: tetratricopeptide repeat protein, partial [Spirochaetales bacterium]|nr:tetratricopeptide repeat protein [Spirochaetales bacterium]